jgi:hypothetical protein
MHEHHAVGQDAIDVEQQQADTRGAVSRGHSQQSAISNQQSAISSQQSAISNQQSAIT